MALSKASVRKTTVKNEGEILFLCEYVKVKIKHVNFELDLLITL